MKVRQGRALLILDVPPASQAGRGTAGDQNRQLHVVVQAGVTHAAAVEVDGVVQQRAIPVRRRLQLLQKAGENRNMVGVDLGDFLDFYRIIAVVAGGMMGLRHADFRIGAITQLAGELEGDDPGDIRLQRQ